MKIEKLTKEQEERFQEFVDKWTRIGLSTEPADRTKAESSVAKAYAAANLPSPKIVWCGSPFSEGLTRAIIMDKKLWASVGASVRASVWDSVRASVWDSVRASVGDSVGDSVRASVGESVGESVGDSVRASVGASVWDSVRASVGASVGACGYGQHDANWIGFYNFFRVVCLLENETQKLNGMTGITESAGWYLPHQKLCWISERHNTLKRNEQGRLHCDGGAAVEYPDGWQIFALNGVRVSQVQAETPGEKMTPESVLAETNVDIRRELIRKVGIERMLAKLPHKEIAIRGNYRLLSVKLSDEVTDARFLKMQNPSVGCFHLEGVAPECDTVEKALNWRNSNWHTDADVLT
jgi:hypothetical protein